MAGALASALQRHDIVLDHVASLAEAREALATDVHHAILLDRRLPDGEGLDLVRCLRRGEHEALRHLPVIVLTARGEIEDRVAGLDAGADDYLPKPFAVEELLARLRAILRRPGAVSERSLRIARLTFDSEHREASVGGTRLDLPRRELLVLETLLRRAGRTVMRAVLEEAVYGYSDEIQSNALDAHVSRLRRKLTEAGAGLEIHNVRGVGYLLRPAS
jgi:Response regulators consisting of a CheY-like receiver domain and a winged-helix DNA-binding domain